MRKPVLLIFVNAMILIVVFVLLAQSLLVVQRVAQADGVQGIVEVQRQGRGEFLALSSGQPVAVGDVVRTGRDGQAEFTWADKTRWRIMPDAQLTVAQATINSAKSSESSRFQLDAGKLFVRVVKPLKEGSSFEVRTPDAATTVRGTVFSVDAKPNGTTRVETFAGRVEVESEGHKAMVEPGMAALTGAKTIQLTPISGTDFRAFPELINPNLTALVRPLNGDVTLVQGTTEVGNLLEINGQRALMLGDGSFARRFTLSPGHNEWQIVATDKHGAKSNLCRALDYDASTGATSASACR